MNKKIERTAAYIRVSTQEQKLHGISLDAQKDKLTEYAQKHNLKIVEWYKDEGVSGRKLIKNRPELQRMIKDAQKGKFERIIFIKLDRFFRSIAEYHECMKLIEPVIWTATEEKYDLSNANGRAFVNMKLTIAELEADQTGERIRLVNDYKVKTGKPLTDSFPFYYKLMEVDGEKKIKRNPETAHIFVDALQHFFLHQSIRKTLLYINDKYEAEGFRTSYSSLCRAMKNPLMCGSYRDNENYIPQEESYLSKEEFEKLQSLITRQAKVNSKRTYIFGGLVKCPICGGKMVGSKHTIKRPNNTYVYSTYRCAKHRREKTCSYGAMVFETAIERKMLAQIEEIFEGYKLELVNLAEDLEQNPVNASDKIEKLQAELDRLNYSWQKGRIKDVNFYDEEYDRLIGEIEKLKEVKVKETPKDVSHIEELLKGNWKEIYNKLSQENKKAFWRNFVEAIELDTKKDIHKVEFF